MAGQEDYEDAWEIAIAAKGVRPATLKAVVGWLNSHEEDARLAESCKIGPTTFSVGRTEKGFQIGE